MVDTKGNASAPLIASLLDAFMAAGRTRAVLPPNRRDEVIAVLTRLMADPDALDAYTATLEDERRRRGRDVELRLLGMAGLDIPGDQIATEGFGGLSDDHLADIALSPEAIHAIREHLDEAECGAWLIDKIIEVESARPEAAECAAGQRRSSRASEISGSWAPTSQIRSRWEKRRNSDQLLSDRCFTPVLACWLSPQACSSACSSAASSSAAEDCGLRPGEWMCFWPA